MRSVKNRRKRFQNQSQRQLILEQLEIRQLLAATIFQESFESAPGGSYTLSSPFQAGFDYFDRFPAPDNSNAARDDFQLGWDGGFGVQGQDHDGQGGSATRSITIPGISIAGQSNLQLTVALGALSSEPAFFNFEAADGDRLELYATVDGGSKTLVGRFTPPAGGAGDLYLDTDLDGVGDGPNLTSELTDYSFALPATGSSLTVEIELTTTDSFESIAVDNVRVEIVKPVLSEIVVTPTAGEFIEVHNPDGLTIDLSDYYITDATFSNGGVFYYNIVTGSDAGGGGFGDFFARFPAGATIAPGEYQTIALNGSDGFASEFGFAPTYELYEDGPADAIPDMREALPGSINGQGGLSNSGEFVSFFHWDGVSDLVTDVDYVVWGDKVEAVDKTGVSIDGPDGDAATSTYANDTSIASQDVISSGSHAFGLSFQRVDLTEGLQITSGGNGVGGSDETSEDFSNTWDEATPTPNAAFTTDNGQPPVFEQTGPFDVSENAPSGTVVGDVNANDGNGADEGVTYTLVGDSMMVGQMGFDVTPILTVGDTLSGTTGALNSSTAGDYQPVGILDGIGAYELDSNTVRAFVNHEFNGGAGASYEISNGIGGSVTLTGARISYFDIDKTTRTIIDAGIAYNQVFGRDGTVVDDAGDINEESHPTNGFDRFCSSVLIEADQFGLGNGIVDDIYFAGEETSVEFGHPHGGSEWALDITTGHLYAIPAMGRGSWENVTQIDTGTTTHVAFLLGDDIESAPLYLYVGEKDAAAGTQPFLNRNGLEVGQLYVWAADNGDLSPQGFNGTGASRSGTWLPIDAQDLAQAGQPGHDVAGYKDDVTLRTEADAMGAFSFSRPEDLAVNPANSTQVAFASTGRGGVFPADNWGATYIIDVDLSNLGTLNPLTADISILYDGDDAGGGQFAHPDYGLRSQDNLDWADDGLIYIQEDRSTSPSSEFGGTSGEEASIWQVNPNNGDVKRVAQIDRTAVLPLGSTDSDPNDLGDWESSGILDVSSLFGEAPGSLFLFDVQAHSIRDGVIADNELVQGGQLSFLARGVEASGAFEINPNTGVITIAKADGIDASDQTVHTLTVIADDGNDSAVTTVTVNVNSDEVELADEIRFASFNASLNRGSEGELITDLSTTGNFQAQNIAEIIQRTAPDVLLINEFDFDAKGTGADLFRDNYLEVSQNGADPIYYPYVYNAPSNTGIASGFDLDNNSSIGGPGDAFGFGNFEGQFGMLLLSKYPIVEDEVRTFQQFLWKDMPGAMLPDDPGTGAPQDWYSLAELDVFRLSSKSHWDIPIDFNGDVIHALTSHPTPPVFDGPEDRNGTRNHDEIRFWADYINPAESGYIYDDVEFAAAGFDTPGLPSGGLPAGSRFVIMGDQNADPFDGDSTAGAAQQLTDNPLINTSLTPASPGGPEQAILQGGDNASHVGNPAFDTSDFGEPPGNLRVDYVLPSLNLQIEDGGVFWPKQSDPTFPLVSASDHRLVWVDLDPQPLPGANLFGTTLQVTGTESRDLIRVDLDRRSGDLVVKLGVREVGRFEPGDVELIKIDGKEGNDLIRVGSRVQQYALIRGGLGNDLIISGGGNSAILGGEGRDTVRSGNARNVLIGGIGRDLLAGGRNEDLLIGGTTAHDSNDAALLDILAEWSGAGSHVQRTNNLRTGNGVPPLNASTVFADSDRDLLLGRSGSDFFLLNPLDSNDGRPRDTKDLL